MVQHVLVIAGTRPEAIKLAPVIHELQARPEQFRVTVCATGQHREMLQQAFSDFDITPDVDLAVMSPDQTLASLSARLFTEVDALLDRESPDWVLVQGDTTTVAVASLCAFYRRIPVGHVEAGLRSGDRFAPFPEEVNRRVAGIVADLHFAPTAWAKDNLLREGVADSAVVVTGNTVIDALLWMRDRVREEKPALPDVVEQAIDDQRRIVLITGHRRESFGEGLANVCQAIRSLAERHRDCLFVYPVHLNPNVLRPVHERLGGCDTIALIEPLTYKPFVRLMDASTIILTDSGGIQEEAPSLGKPILVTRTVTERPEGVDAGVARLVGTDTDLIVKLAEQLLDDPAHYATMADQANPYGDGRSAERIADAVLAHGQAAADGQ